MGAKLLATNLLEPSLVELSLINWEIFTQWCLRCALPKYVP